VFEMPWSDPPLRMANGCSIMTGMAAVVPTPLTPLSRLREIADQARPVTLAREQVLPVVPALQHLFPGGAVQRGITMAVGGEAATSLALAVAAGPSSAGSWTAVVGVPHLGLVAAAEAGLVLERLVLVREPPPVSWATVIAALVGAFDVIIAAPVHRVGAGDARRLAARLRERGSVLVQIDAAGRADIDVDVRLTATHVRWSGLHDGHGHLRSRRVSVEASGRRRAARARQASLWLPSAGGAIVAATPQGDESTSATISPLRRQAG
jgi:hypothetical protein